MVNQKAISAKLDYRVAEQLEKEAYTSAMNKNRIINIAVEHYVEFRDLQRRLRCCDKQADRWGLIEHYFNAKGMGYLLDGVPAHHTKN